MRFEVFGIVKSNGKKIAVGDNGIFETNDEKIIFKLDNLGFKRLGNSGTIINGNIPEVTTHIAKIDTGTIQETLTEKEVIEPPLEVKPEKVKKGRTKKVKK